MPKIAFFNVPAFGHTSPTLRVVEELLDNGYSVHYYTTERFRELIVPTGAVFHESPMFAEYNQRPARTLLHILALIAKQTYYYLPNVVQEIRKVGYSAVVHDQLCLWARGACSITGTPAICSSTMLPLTRTMIREFASFRDLLRAALLGGPAFLRFLHYRRKLRDDFKLQRLSPFDVLSNYSDLLTIVFTTREMLPAVEDFDNTFCFVGPSFRPRTSETKLPACAYSERSIIYISLGTIVDDAPSFYRMCVEALQGIDAQVIMSIGRKIKKEDVGRLPENFYVSEFVPQMELLKRTDIFISHGGMNSITESLSHGVPMILCPRTPEQKLNARIVEKNGAAIYLRKKQIHAESLRKNVENMLEGQDHRNRARFLGESLRSAGGPKRAAEMIDAVVARSGRNHDSVLRN